MGYSPWLLAPLAVLAACSSDTFGNDGGPDASDAMTLDVLMGDGTSPGDASVHDVIVKTPRFCDGELDASFCADFDIPNDAGAGFAPPDFDAPYSLDFENTLFASPPMAVQANVPMAAAGGHAWLFTAVGVDAGATNGVTLDMEINLPAIPGFTTAISGFYFGSPNFEYGIAMLSNAYSLISRDKVHQTPLNMTPPTQQWLHAHLDVAFGTSNGSVNLVLTQGTNVVATASFSSIQTIGASFAVPATVTLGVENGAPPGADLSFYYDNVVVRLR
jgi:hypothetical protein